MPKMLERLSARARDEQISSLVNDLVALVKENGGRMDWERASAGIGEKHGIPFNQVQYAVIAAESSGLIELESGGREIVVNGERE